MTTRTPKPRLRGHERRELIVEAALDEFADRGYEAASMGRIAEAAGISRTVLYDHFPSKHALFVELLRAEHAALLEHVQAGILGNAPMQIRMRATFEAYFIFAEDRPRSWRLLFPDHPPVDPVAAEEQRRCRTESNRLLAGMLVADAHRAGIDPESPEGRMVFTIHQASLNGLVRWWHTHPEVPRDALVDATMTALWTGLGVAERDESRAA